MLQGETEQRHEAVSINASKFLLKSYPLVDLDSCVIHVITSMSLRRSVTYYHT